MKNLKYIIISIALVLASVFTNAQTVYTVTKTTDPDPFEHPFNNDDNLCDPEMYGTLQWAINKVNANTGESVIEFNIPGNGVHEIVLNSYLPQIKNPVTIDGTTQDGYTQGNPAIKLNGTNIKQSCFQNYNCELNIKGIWFYNFATNVCWLYETENSQIENNIISGNHEAFASNYAFGVAVCDNVSFYNNIIEEETDNDTARLYKYGFYIKISDNLIIGGTEAGQANTIKNCNTGVWVAQSNSVKISGNLIYNNDEAISLEYGSNNGILPPVITNYNSGILYGTSLPNSTIEVFGSTGEEQANEYLTSTLADGNGDWSVEVNTEFEFIIGLQIDTIQNSSEYSETLFQNNLQGSTCLNAILIQNSDTAFTYTFNTDMTLWLNLINDWEAFSLIINSLQSNDEAKLYKVGLFEGECTQLDTIYYYTTIDSLSIFFENLELDLNYLVKLEFDDSSTDSITIEFIADKDLTIEDCPIICPNCIRNSSFEIIESFITNSFTKPFQLTNGVCGWFRAWGTPQIFIGDACDENNCARMYSRTYEGYNGLGTYGEAIYTRINTNVGQEYTFSFCYKQISGPDIGNLNEVCIAFAQFGSYVVEDLWQPWTAHLIPQINNAYELSIPEITISNNWQVFSHTFEASADYQMLIIYPKQSENSIGWLAVDNVMLETHSEPTFFEVENYCVNDQIVNLSEPSLSTGIWTGNGIIEQETGLFDPSVAGEGVHELVFSIGDDCEEYYITTITVDDIPDPTIYPVAPMCLNDDPIYLQAIAMGVGSIWSGDGIIDATSGYFDPNVAGIGIHNIHYSITNGACSAVSSIEITVLEPPEITIEPVYSVCYGGSVEISAISEAVNYQWFGPNNFTSINSSFTLTNVQENMQGEYMVVVTDENGCTNSAVTQVIISPSPIVSFNPAIPVVCNDETIDITAIVSEGSLPYNYEWNTGEITQTITATGANSEYTVTVTDENECTGEGEITILGSNLSIKGDIVIGSCDNQNNGSIYVAATDGVPPYQFNWSGPNYSANNTSNYSDQIENLVHGMYYLTITDFWGCTFSTEFEVESIPSPILEITSDYVCNSESTGVLEVSVANNLDNLEYEWSNGQASSTIEDLLPGEYTVTVTEENGCSSIATTIVEDYITNAEFSLNYPCLDLDRLGVQWYYNYNFDFDFTSIDSENYDFYWDLGNGTTSTEMTVPVDYTMDGYYCVTATVSREECVGTSSELVYVNPNRCFCMESTFTDGFYEDYTVNSAGEDWLSINRRIRGNIIVPNGATLYLHKCNLYFGSLGRIIIEPGGVLLVSNTLMTSMQLGPECNAMWQGIEVHGKVGLPPEEQGSVSFINGGSKIENAHIGILLGERNTDYVCNNDIDPELAPFNSNGSCGWADVEDVEFINNGTDIRFVKPMGNTQYQNISSVYSSDFTCIILLDECYNSNHPDHYGFVNSPTSFTGILNTRNPWAGGSNLLQRSPQSVWIQNHNIMGNFKGNTFLNKEICMETYDSKYNVYSSEFYNTLYGIKIRNTNSSIITSHNIEQNKFTVLPGYTYGTKAHISISGNRFDRIRDNYFGQQNSLQSQTNFGIFLRGASNFRIEENDFTKILTGISVIESGANGGDIRAGISSIHDDWRGNVFTQCNTNILTKQDNSNLRLRCNNCLNNLNSIYTVNFANKGVLANQGILIPFAQPQQNWGAGNEFTDGNDLFPSEVARRLTTNTTYEYYHHTDVKTTPTLYPNSTVIEFGSIYMEKAQNPEACPTMAVNPSFPINPQYPIVAPLPSIQSFLPIREDVNDEIELLKFEYDNLILSEDNGITQELLTDIAQPMANGKLKNKLIANSPLSDTVITALLIEYPLSHGNFKNVMKLNMPVSPEVSPYLHARLETVPQGIYNQLFSLQTSNTNFTTATSIKRQIDYWENERNLLINDIITALLDTAYYSPDLVKEILESENTLEAKQLLISTAIAGGDYTEAQDLLNTINPETQKISDWIQYHQLLLTLFENENSIYNMDSVQLSFIVEQAYKCPADYTSANAQALLSLLFGIEVPECVEMTNRNTIQLVKDVDFTLPESDAYIMDNFPDPFTDYTLINYYLPEETEGRIIVSDITGRIISEYNLVNGENTLEIRNNNWATGVYSYGMIVNGKPIEFKKMIIN